MELNYATSLGVLDIPSTTSAVNRCVGGVRLRAKKSTTFIGSVSIAISVLPFAGANIFHFTEKFWSWKNLVLMSAVLIVLETYLRVSSRESSRRIFIDVDYVKNLGPDFHGEFVAHCASHKLGIDFNLYCLENQVECRHIKVVNESRYTVAQPPEPDAHIFILGGSTVFNAEVPNSHTIASLLQSKLHENRINHSVINFGKSGATSIDRIEFIKNQEVLSKGDAVVLHFGINDACIMKPNFEFKTNPIHLILVVFNLVQTRLSKCLLSFEKLPRFGKFGTKYAVKKYVNEEVVVAIRSFSNYCEKIGVKFVAVLQPSAYSCRALNRNERRYLNQFANSPKRALQVANREVIKELGSDSYFVDGVRMFDYAEKVVFTDWCHTTKYGNLLLSEFFFSELAKLNYFEVEN